MTLYGGLAKVNMLSEFAGPIEVKGVIKTAAQVREQVLANLGITASLDEINAGADLSAQVSLTPGAGISGTAATVFKVSTVREGGIVTTRILIDLTDQISNDADTDIIGTTAASHLGQFVVATHGTPFSVLMQCLEVPAGGEVDIDLWTADEDTGVYSASGSLITALTGEAKVIDSGGDWTLGRVIGAAAMPGENDYFYLAVGTSSTPTAGTYTAGKFLITIHGYDA